MSNNDSKITMIVPVNNNLETLKRNFMLKYVNSWGNDDEIDLAKKCANAYLSHYHHDCTQLERLMKNEQMFNNYVQSAMLLCKRVSTEAVNLQVNN